MRIFPLFFLLITNALLSQTTLSAGDIAIIQYNSDGSPEQIKFLTLTSIEAGTEIKFTDNGWTSAGNFRANEGIIKWTAPTNYSCGAIINMNMEEAATIADTSLTPIDNGFNLSGNGDQILVYQGTEAAPTFIFAINNEGSAIWQSDATSSNTSSLPPGLTNGTNAVALTEKDNAKYDNLLTGLTGSKTTILTNICTPANWSGHNTTNQIFTETFNTNWNGSNWDGTSGDFLSVTINGDYDTNTDGDFSACNCTVNASQTLTVNSGGTVTVENDITNNGTILVKTGGSVVQVSPFGVNTGTGYTVERETTSQSSRFLFTYWSSPISTATFAAVAADARLYFSYNTSGQNWTAGSNSSSMSPGIGYALQGPDAGASYPGTQTASFTGAPFNTGDISIALDAGYEWNLVGNPYPSAIDADTFLADNAAVLGGTIYFWTHNTEEDGTVNNTEDDYAMYNTTGGTMAITGGVIPDGNIASTQGFFAQALSSGPMLFTNSMRIAANNTVFFKSNPKKNETTNIDRIWLNLTNENSFSQILVGFLEDATDAIDRKYDGIRFEGKKSLNFYSILEDKDFAIQGLGSLKDENYIPLGFSTNTTGTFNITIDKSEGAILNSKVFIIDQLLNIKHEISKTPYSFSTLESGKFNSRFILSIEKTEKTLTVNEEEYSSKLLIENFNTTLIIRNLNNKLIKQVVVYNVLGKALLSKETASKEVQLTSNILKTNTILIVKTLLEDGTTIINKIIKN